MAHKAEKKYYYLTILQIKAFFSKHPKHKSISYCYKATKSDKKCITISSDFAALFPRYFGGGGGDTLNDAAPIL